METTTLHPAGRAAWQRSTRRGRRRA